MRSQALRRFAMEQVLLAALFDRRLEGGEIAFIERIDDVRQALWLTHPNGAGARKIVDFRSYTIGGVAWRPYPSTLGGRDQPIARLENTTRLPGSDPTAFSSNTRAP